MKIASWNINGIKARLDNLLTWLEEAQPDIVCLQELKSVDENFPRMEIEALGYNVETFWQKSFNGVAILSKLPFDEVNRALPVYDIQDEDEQARFIEGVFTVGEKPLRVVSLYLPNGNPVDSEKFPYKLGWMDRLEIWARQRLELEEPLILCGDYNVIPMPRDASRPEAWVNDALFKPESRARFRRLLNLGFTEAFRNVNDDDGQYTFWDYTGGSWQKNDGIRIDHLLMSPEAANRLNGVVIDKHTRSWERPSDHVPIWLDYAA